MALIEALIAFIISLTGAASITVDEGVPHTKAVETLEVLHASRGEVSYEDVHFEVNPTVGWFAPQATFYCGLFTTAWGEHLPRVETVTDPVCDYRAVTLHELGHLADWRDDALLNGSIEPGACSVETAADLWGLRRAQDSDMFWGLYASWRRHQAEC